MSPGHPALAARMRILILTQYYPPETGAPQNRLSDLARRLKRRGHKVTVLTAMPNYPRGRVFEGYGGRARLEETIEGIRVVRTWVYAREGAGFSFARRLLSYLSFCASSFAFGWSKTGPLDVVIVESPPLFLGLSGWLISRLRRAAMVMNVSDLWPRSAVEMGLLHDRRLVSLATALEEFLYRRSSLITGQARGILDDIRLRFPDKPVTLITNGVELESYAPAPTGSRVREQLSLGRRFVVGYAGLHGIAQGLDVLIEAARLIAAGGDADVCFLLVGDGPDKARLQGRAGSAGLRNVLFLPPVPHREMPEVFAAFDVAVVPLKRLDVFKGVLPSKLFEAMAAGRPVIASVDGEVREIVEAANGGLYVEPERPDLMAAAITRLYRNPAERQALGANAREYVIRHFDREKIAESFERSLIETLGQRR